MRLFHPFFVPHFFLCSSFLVSVVLAAVVASDANRRGMNGILWGVGVFLLCIVFLPLYLIMRSPAQPTASTVQASSPNVPPGARQSKYCNSCGTELPENARFCSRCGWTQPG